MISVDIVGLVPERMVHALESIDTLEMAEVVAEAAIDLIIEGMDREHDPYGKPHEKLVLRDGVILEDTAGMRNSWARQSISPTSVVLINGKEYSDYHQSGTGVYGPRKRRIVPKPGRVGRGGGPAALKIPGLGFRRSVAGSPRRMMVPDGELPDTWQQEFEGAVVDYITSTLES